MSKVFAFTKRHFLTLLPVVTILIFGTYFLINAATNEKYNELTGSSLAANDAIYPVVFDSDGAMTLDTKVFMRAVEFLSRNPNHQRAAADLIYLGQSNHIELRLSDEENQMYHKLIGHGFFDRFSDVNRQRDELLLAHKQIVDGIGKTFAGTDIEVVLHDTRDPLHSIKALQNPISGRVLGDPNSRFGVNLIKMYAKPTARPVNYVGYPLQLKDGRAIKSTTIPLYDKRFGLIGFICMNIDTSKIQTTSITDKATTSMLENFVQTTPSQGISEVLEVTRAHK